MIDDIGMIDSMMAEISSCISEDVTLFIIGGGALMYMGEKSLTKDIDCVVLSVEEYDAVRSALFRLGFESVRPTLGFERMDLSDMFVRDDGMRIDLFQETVCRKLKLSDSMVSRSRRVASHGRLSINICSAEDVLIFKSITERDGDEDDCINLIMSSLDWGCVLDEIRKQVAEGEEMWIDWIANRLKYLSEKHGADIPILDTLMGMADEFMERWVAEMSAKLDEED